MMKVGQELFLGMDYGYLQVIDIQNLEITHTSQFQEIARIHDILQINDSQQLLLAGAEGLLKATKDQVIKHYFKQEPIITICHIAESVYLVGFEKDGLTVWKEQTDQQLFKVCQDQVFSIKRVLTTNTYIIKTEKNGLKLLSIKNLKTSKFLLQDLLKAAEEDKWNYTCSLQVSYVTDSHLMIITTQNEEEGFEY